MKTQEVIKELVSCLSDAKLKINPTAVYAITIAVAKLIELDRENLEK